MANVSQQVLILVSMYQFFFKQEVQRIKNELTLPDQTGLTRDVSMIFDGSTRQREAIAVIVDFLDDNWSII